MNDVGVYSYWMLGLFITLAFTLAGAVAGSKLLHRYVPDLDPCESFGLGGVLGLGTIGLATLLFGLISVPLALGAIVLLLAAVLWATRNLKTTWKFALPKGFMAIFPTFVCGLGLLALVAVLAPSDMTDWDSLAYHLAVPKLWLQSGHVGFVQAIHHSNFPFTADMLYVWGLLWGGEPGAKSFSLAWGVLGCLTLFGLARRWYGEKAAWWSVLAFAGCPVVLWEAGTAYIDIAHGLCCGLAVVYLADALKTGFKSFWILSGVTLGLAMGTKHTGLQTFVAIALVGALAILVQARSNKDGEGQTAPKGGLKSLALACGLALAIALPWYVKSTAYTGNPVYPFFYKQLGGKYWNQWRADVYTREQKTFGVGSNPMELGHAILGLAYQPGRYVNPGQSLGMGFPTGSIGFVGLLAALLWCFSGQSLNREKTILACAGVGLLFWFLLSQQSRYLISIEVPLIVLAAGAVARLNLGKTMSAGIVLQAAYSAWMLWTLQTSGQIPVVSGQVSPADYQAKRVGFYAPAQDIDNMPDVGKVALYDEVFGFFLDKPYMWANPGHSTLIPYESSDTAAQWVDSMRRLGFTHAYANMNKNFIDATVLTRWQDAMGDTPYSPEEKATMRDNPDLWWRVLFADAVHQGPLKPVKAYPEGSSRPQSVLFKFER